ncbi:MAG TPA: IS630 family transposase [Thermoleophilia bacterium]|nr:IS630 family transposase [Thermoleophilia bacterium]
MARDHPRQNDLAHLLQLDTSNGSPTHPLRRPHPRQHLTTHRYTEKRAGSDEKTGIQAKAPTRADVQARPGRPARREHEYTRNGTQNLFAALRVHSGEVSAMPSKTRNRFDLLRFLDQLETEIPAGREVIAISDNLSTRTTQEVSDWLADHPRWRFVFTPKHASWLNQVEIVFSILARRLLKRGAFADETDLAQQMLAVETYNQTARPFNWTYTGKVLTA